MMATTFGHNFNFAAAKQNGEAFQQFPSHGLSLCLPLHLSHSLCPWARSENFHFLKLSANVFYTFPQTPSENAAWPRISMRMHTPRGDKVGRNVIISAGSAARGRGEGQVGMPWAKRAQASTTTRMTSRSSRRLSATATATSDARKGLTKRKAMEMLLLLQFSAKNFWCKSSENERSGRNATIYIYIYVYRCGWVYFLGSIRDPGPLNAAHGS